MRPDLHRPHPSPPGTHPEVAGRPLHRVAQDLLAGRHVLLRSAYGEGAEILDEVRRRLPVPPPSAPYAMRVTARGRQREALLRLHAPVRGHRVQLEGSRPIGFLQELYPGLPDFDLPLLELQELHGAWGRYREGVHLAVLGHRVHPFFGTYAPTRTTHLELFGTWLSQYRGSLRAAVDVGTGCGVLARMLAKRGFEHVRATDTNPNAVESVRRDLTRHPAPALEPLDADLLGPARPWDVVVFNPPWLVGDVREPFDAALYHDTTLLPRFFEAAHRDLAPDGRVVVLFSTIGRLTQPEHPHPVEHELDQARFRCVQRLQRRVPPSPGRRRTSERVEVWELERL